MEVTRKQLELVHVLPFTVRPNQRLQELLGETFVKPGLEKPRFLFKTMSSLAIDATHQHDTKVRKALFDARFKLDRNPFTLELSEQITGQRLANGAFRLYLALEQESIAVLAKQQEVLAELFPDHIQVTDGPHEKMQLMTTIPAAVTYQSKEGVGHAGAIVKKALADTAGKSEYVVISEDIQGSDEQRLITRIERTEDKAS